jgi:HEAT repeat protein
MVEKYAAFLSRIGDDRLRQALVIRLNDSSEAERVRNACALVFGFIGDETSRQVLINQLNNKETEESVRQACALSLSIIGDKVSVNALIVRFNDRTEPEVLHWWYVCCLAEVKDEVFRQNLIEQLNNKGQASLEELLQIVLVLAQSGMDGCHTFLTTWLNNTNTPEAVRKACMDALDKFGTRS